MRRRASLSRRSAEVPTGEPAADPMPSGAPDEAAADQLSLDEQSHPVAAGAPELVTVPPPAPVDPVARLAEYRRRVAANGADISARRELARLLVPRGELTLALEHLEAARATAPEDPGLVLELADVLVALRRFDPAEKELRRLLKFQPDNGAAWLLLGSASLRRGLYGQAAQELERATSLLPESSVAHLHRGEALNHLERLDEALAMLERTVQLDPGNGRAYYLMGILYDKKNLPQEAAALYRKAREAGSR